MNWISVNERLPEKRMPILITNRCGDPSYIWIADAIHEDSDKPAIKDGKYCAFARDSMRKIWGITHWMPLPEPPSVEPDTRGPEAKDCGSCAYGGFEICAAPFGVPISCNPSEDNFSSWVSRAEVEARMGGQG